MTKHRNPPEAATHRHRHKNDLQTRGILSCLRQNDRKEHTVDCDSKYITDHRRQNSAKQCTEQRSRLPADKRKTDQSVKIANTKPLLKPPINNPSTPGTPKMSPVKIGAIMAIKEGTTISR
mgnify:CR=1 FL=1